MPSFSQSQLQILLVYFHGIDDGGCGYAAE